MTEPRRPQFTIGHMMAAIAALATLFAVPNLKAPNPVVLGWLLRGIVSLAVFVLLAALVHNVFENLLGMQCPGCKRLTLRRLARVAGYYRCTCCGLRLKRAGVMGWADASGRDDAEVYRRKDADRPWSEFQVPETDDLEATTTGTLLGHQRGRRRGRPPAAGNGAADGKGASC